MKKLIIIIPVVLILLVAIYFVYTKLEANNEEDVSEKVENTADENNTETNELTNSLNESNILTEETNTLNETNTENTVENTSSSTSTTKVDSNTLSFLYLSATSYVGNAKSAQDVQICLNTIMTLNRGNADTTGNFIAFSINGKNVGKEGDSKLSSSEIEKTESEVKEILNTIDEDKTYTISASYGSNKYMSKITVKEE